MQMENHVNTASIVNTIGMLVDVLLERAQCLGSIRTSWRPV